MLHTTQHTAHCTLHTAHCTTHCTQHAAQCIPHNATVQLSSLKYYEEEKKLKKNCEILLYSFKSNYTYSFYYKRVDFKRKHQLRALQQHKKNIDWRKCIQCKWFAGVFLQSLVILYCSSAHSLISLNIYFLRVKSNQYFLNWKCIKKAYVIF